ncbi:MAG: MEDS domain-containing protein [Actinomycetota bacterium]|nr:MEDS domain-containing protein [Actinomycetota bacterium]
MRESPRSNVLDSPEIAPRSHVCWVVADAMTYEAMAVEMLIKGRESGEKIFAFGPADSESRKALRHVGALVADPYTDFLGGGAFDPEAMFTMFRAQMDAARAEGWDGLRVVADMDWLIPTGATTEEVVAFEARLDSVVHELGATVVCAYRAETFDADAIDGIAAVHPVVSGADPAFQLVSTGAGRWRLSGEIDFSALASLDAALEAITREPAVIDLADLRFIDCAGMRSLARTLASSEIRLTHIPRFLRRQWDLTGLSALAPLLDGDGLDRALLSP